MPALNHTLTPCPIEGCGRTNKVKRPNCLCEKHYRNIVRYGHPTDIGDPINPCLVEGCNSPKARSNGLCVMHSKRQIRTGDPTGLVRRTGYEEKQKFMNDLVARPPDHCVRWPWFVCKDTGYGYYIEKKESVGAHRLILSMYTGVSLGTPLFALHGPCNNRACVNPKHLYWGTPTQNVHDRDRDGTSPVGERGGKSRLTDAQVLAIRDDDRRIVDIAADYGVGKSTIGYVKQGKTWRHLLPNRT